MNPYHGINDSSYAMPDIKKILLPVDFPNTSLRVIHQAAAMAHHFRSEIVMLHVVTALSQAAGLPQADAELTGWDMLSEVIRVAEKNADRSLGPALGDLTIKRVLVKGRTAWAIVQAAQEEGADLIMMPSHGNTFDQFLLSSVTAKVLHWTECPVWTDAHVEESPEKEFDVRHILCAVDFTTHNRKAVSWAVQMATKFGSRLTLAHVTPSAELWGPGGSYVNPKFKKVLVGDASKNIAQLQQAIGIKTDAVIGSGDVPMVLNQAVKQTGADLLITGCRPYGRHLRTHGYAIIRAVPIPVLSM